MGESQLPLEEYDPKEHPMEGVQVVALLAEALKAAGPFVEQRD